MGTARCIHLPIYVSGSDIGGGGGRSNPVSSAEIITFYSGYMDVDRAESAGICLADACILYDPYTVDTRGGRLLMQLAKSEA